jgi:hypothetical protein
MATSGTTTFTVNRDEIIKAALRTLEVIGVGETPIAEDYQNCSEALNIMIKSWAKKGFPLWTYDVVEVPMVDGFIQYPLGPTAAYIGAVSSTGGTGYTAGTWTAVGGTTGTPASGTYTVSSGAPDVFTVTVPGDSYTSAPTSFTLSGAGTGAVITASIVGVTIPRPLRILTAFIRNNQNLDTTLFILSRQEYDIQGNKFSEAIPNQLYYDVQLENGQMYVFNAPSPSAAGYVVHALTQRQFQDMDDAANTFDFPQEWFQALKWGLANELADEYGVSDNKLMRVQGKAEQAIADCFDWSQEEADVFFTMDYQGTKKKW